MHRLLIVALATALISPSAHPQKARGEATAHHISVSPSRPPNLPSEEEIGDLLNKAREYVHLPPDLRISRSISLSQVQMALEEAAVSQLISINLERYGRLGKR